MQMAAAVATLEQKPAAKIGQEKTLGTASPPGRKPTQRATAVKSPRPMPEWRRIALMKTKSGTAMKEKLVAFDHATDPTTPSPTVQPLSQSSPSTPTTPSDTAISSPIANRTNISAMRSAPSTGSLKRGGPGGELRHGPPVGRGSR